MTDARAANPGSDLLGPVRLRSDLRVTSDEDGGFIIEDSRRGQFFRLGPAEYRIIAQLDGRLPLGAAIRQASLGQPSLGQPSERLSAARLNALVNWLLASGLLESQAPGAVLRPGEERSPAKTPGFNPCYVRLPFGPPGKLLVASERVCGWLCSAPALALVAILSVAAGLAIVQDWQSFSGSLAGILCPDQHLALLGCWLLLKLTHELGHGVACQRLGGEVRDCGLAFIFLMPVPYTDVTSSWRFGSRLERMAVAAAGMYFEWLVALGAVAVWSIASSPAVRQLCVYTVSLATLTTILFNANPLCRLDGYFLLSDLLRWPNLSAQGQRVAAAWLRPWQGRAAFADAEISGRRYGFALLYGVAAALWRVLTLVTMAVLAVLSYEGFGALLVAAVVIGWYAPAGVTNFAATARQARLFMRPSAWCWTGLVAAVVALAWHAPWPFPATAPGVVEHVTRHVVRARSPGQIAELFVENGQQVARGQPLARLHNDQLALELAQLELASAQGEAKLRALRTRHQLVDAQVEEQRQETLATRLAEQRRALAALTLTAPAAGRVTARRLADLPGSYLAEGAELCQIVAGGSEFRLSLAERDLPQFSASLGKPVEVRLPGRTIAGILTQLAPHAATALPYPGLGAGAGGPLAVVPAGSQLAAGADYPDAWRLVEPRISGTISLKEADQAALLAGQRGSAALRGAGHTVGTRLTQWLRRWLTDLGQRAQPHAAQRANCDPEQQRRLPGQGKPTNDRWPRVTTRQSGPVELPSRRGAVAHDGFRAAAVCGKTIG